MFVALWGVAVLVTGESPGPPPTSLILTRLARKNGVYIFWYVKRYAKTVVMQMQTNQKCHGEDKNTNKPRHFLPCSPPSTSAFRSPTPPPPPRGWRCRRVEGPTERVGAGAFYAEALSADYRRQTSDTEALFMDGHAGTGMAVDRQ